MNLKKTVFGIGAATVLSLSMVGGVMAEEEMETQSYPSGPSADAQVDTSVKLKAGTCSLISVSGSGNFGEVEWDGTAYASNPTANLDVRDQNKLFKKDCDLQAKATDLITSNYPKKTIDAKNLSYKGYNSQSSVQLSSRDYKTVRVIDKGGPRTNTDVVTLNLSDDFAPDTYTGTLYFHVNRGN